MKREAYSKVIKNAAILIVSAAFSIPAFCQEGVRHEAKSFKLEGFTKAGQKQWEIEGESAEMVSDEIVFLKIKAVSFHKDISVTLTADKGTYDKKTGQVQLEGNVEAVTSDGGSLTTDRASWSAKGEEVKTDSLVKVSKDGIVSVGKGGTANPNKKTATLKEDIKVNVPPATVITCDGPFDMYYGEKKAIFNNNVRVTDEGGEMFADEVTAFFNPESHEIVRAIAKGSVKIIRNKTSDGDFISAPVGN